MPTYDPNGRGHRLLNALRGGPLRLPEVAEHLPDAMTHRRRVRRTWHILESLAEHDFVRLASGRYMLTEDGEAARRTLETGEGVEAFASCPTVRIFT